MRNRTESEWLQKRKGKEEREKEARGRKREREQERERRERRERVYFRRQSIGKVFISIVQKKEASCVTKMLNNT